MERNHDHHDNSVFDSGIADLSSNDYANPSINQQHPMAINSRTTISSLLELEPLTNLERFLASDRGLTMTTPAYNHRDDPAQPRLTPGQYPLPQLQENVVTSSPAVTIEPSFDSFPATGEGEQGIDASELLWDDSIQGASQARTWLNTQPTNFNVASPAKDDIELEKQHADLHARSLFNAIFQNPPKANPSLDTAFMEAFDKYQDKAMADVEKIFGTVSGRLQVQTRCILAIDDAISLHTKTKGLPAGSKSAKFEGALKFSARVAAMVRCVQIKTVALGVLNGDTKTLSDLVQAPKALYVQREHQVKNNTKKKNDAAAGKAKRKGQKSSEESAQEQTVNLTTSPVSLVETSSSSPSSNEAVLSMKKQTRSFRKKRSSGDEVFPEDHSNNSSKRARISRNLPSVEQLPISLPAGAMFANGMDIGPADAHNKLQQPPFFYPGNNTYPQPYDPFGGIAIVQNGFDLGLAQDNDFPGNDSPEVVVQTNMQQSPVFYPGENTFPQPSDQVGGKATDLHDFDRGFGQGSEVLGDGNTDTIGDTEAVSGAENFVEPDFSAWVNFEY